MCDQEILYNNTAIIKLLLLALIGGWVSGALGLGGGVIFNPILLAMGVHPKVVPATAMYMIMFSSFASSVMYLVYGEMDFRYALWVGLICLIGSLVGLYLIRYLSR
jgi:uncharacterized membrane protein YfcA